MATAARRKGSWLKPQPVDDWKTHYRELWKPEMTTPSTEPNDRMTLAAFQAAREATRKAAAAFDRIKPDCKSCAHFDMGDCRHFGAPIPKEFQEAPEQCAEWQFDGIPF